VTPQPVRLEVADVSLSGDLSLPADARGLVPFAHGSGSSRHSPRYRAVAEVLQHGRLGTLLLDLLTEREELAHATTAQFRFDIPSSLIVSSLPLIGHRRIHRHRRFPSGYSVRAQGRRLHSLPLQNAHRWSTLSSHVAVAPTWLKIRSVRCVRRLC
jgi:hypothetical protein